MLSNKIKSKCVDENSEMASVPSQANGDLGDATRNLIVPEECYFMLRDNSAVSIDSRYWEEPFIAIDQILHARFFIGGKSYVEFFSYFIEFGFGMTMGLIRLLQAGKMANEEMAMLLEKKKQEEKKE